MPMFTVTVWEEVYDFGSNPYVLDEIPLQTPQELKKLKQLLMKNVDNFTIRSPQWDYEETYFPCGTKWRYSRDPL